MTGESGFFREPQIRYESFRAVKCVCGTVFDVPASWQDPSRPFHAFCPVCKCSRSFYSDGLPMQ